MQPHVFKMNPLLLLLFPAIFFVVMPVMVFVANAPMWILAFLVIPLVFVFAIIKTKVTIENGVLRHDTMTNGREVPLSQVARISVREEVSYTNGEKRSSQTVLVQDENGQTFLSFSFSYVGRKRWSEFMEIVHESNPNIQFD